MTIAANAQRRIKSLSPKDSTSEAYPVTNINFRVSASNEIIFTFARKPGRHPHQYPILLDSVQLLSVKRTITLLSPRADTICVLRDEASKEGYCDWLFTFSLSKGQREVLKTTELDTIVFFNKKKHWKLELTDTKKKMLSSLKTE